MYLKHHTKGIIIENKNVGESSNSALIFTEKFGLIYARVQGARKIQSKLRSNSQVFSFGKFSLVHGKNGWKLVGAISEKNFYESFRNYPDKIRIVGNILNLIKKLTDEERAQTSVFRIILNFFNFLIKASERGIALAECLTLARILHALGYMNYDPEFSIPITSAEIEIEALEAVAPRRLEMIELINESLRAT